MVFPNSAWPALWVGYQLICSLAGRGDFEVRESRAYYISVQGKDSNDGTIANPFRSIQKINTLHLNGGDSILFKSGQSFQGNLLVRDIDSIKQTHPVLISSYGNGIAEINAGDSSAIICQASHNIRIQHVKLTGTGRKKGNTRDGLLIQNSSDISIDHVEISGFQKGGLHIFSSSSIRATHVKAFENGFAGIWVDGIYEQKNSNYNIYLGFCVTENNPGDPTNLDNHSGSGIVVSDCTRVMIEYCTATNNGWDMPRKGNGPVGIWAFAADSVTIQHCLSYKNKTSSGGADGGGFDLDGGVTNSLVQYCLSYENQGAGYCIFQYLNASAWHDNTFRYNISENDGAVSDAQGGVYVWNSAEDSNLFYRNYFYNNTIYNNRVAAISYSKTSDRKGFVFFNNIFVGKDDPVRGNMNADLFKANVWWSLTSSKNSQIGILKKTGFAQNPGFGSTNYIHPTNASAMNDFTHYRIPVNSTFRSAGTDVQKSFGIHTGEKDFNGNTAPPRGVGASF